MKHLAFSGRGKKDEEKIINMSKNNNLNLIKNEITNYLINNSELDLEPLQVCEGGVFMNNKELRFKPPSDFWDFDYKKCSFVTKKEIALLHWKYLLQKRIFSIISKYSRAKRINIVNRINRIKRVNKINRVNWINRANRYQS